MPGASEAARVAAEWVAKAEGDLRAAVQILKIERNCPTDTVVYHAQQCVEKYLKAVLCIQRVPFPKTHNIRLLMDLVPPSNQPQLTDDEQDMLTDYATGARYPGWDDIPQAEARRAVAMARRVRKALRSILSKHAPP